MGIVKVLLWHCWSLCRRLVFHLRLHTCCGHYGFCFNIARLVVALGVEFVKLVVVVVVVVVVAVVAAVVAVVVVVVVVVRLRWHGWWLAVGYLCSLLRIGSF